MSKAVITESLLTAIANAIRSKTGKSDPMTPAQMATEVASIDIGDADAILDGTAVSIKSNATKVYLSALAMRSTLERVDMPNCVQLEEKAFYNDNAITSVNFPKLEHIGNYSLGGLGSLLEIDLPACTTILQNGFAYSSVETVILRSPTMCSFQNERAFLSTPISRGEGYIYVPSALIADYQTAWSTFQFRALEDYTVDGTVSGALDPAKV